jgi:hypothetical protein
MFRIGCFVIYLMCVHVCMVLNTSQYQDQLVLSKSCCVVHCHFRNFLYVNSIYYRQLVMLYFALLFAICLFVISACYNYSEVVGVLAYLYL